MSALRIQKIRSCAQCGDLLPLKCDKCKKHPNRRPRVLSIYDAPPILETGPCGCVRIACQRPGCPKTGWRTLTHAKSYRSQFCSRLCNAKAQAMATCTRKEVPCHECGKTLIRREFELKTHKYSFCNRTCSGVYYMKEAHKKREEKMSDNLQLLICYGAGHRGEITEQMRISGTLHECRQVLQDGKICGARRKVPSIAGPAVLGYSRLMNQVNNM